MIEDSKSLVETAVEPRREFRWMGVDARSLAAFRLAVASIILIDLTLRSVDLQAFYADDGLFPIAAAKAYHANAWIWSLHYLCGAAWYQMLLFALNSLCAVCLLVGYRTRLATAGCWLLAVSLYARNPMVANYGEDVLRLLLFWSMFLPLGQVASLDARRPGRTPTSCSFVSIGSVAILVQLSLLYWFAGVWKINRDWLAGEAVQTAFSIDYCTRPLADALLHYPAILRMLTLATLWLELLGPFLIWIPWRNAQLRLLAVAAFASLHVSIELCFPAGILSYTCIAAWLIVLPAEFWDSRLIRSLRDLIQSRLPPRFSPDDRSAIPGPSLPFRRSDLLSRLSQGLCGILLIYVVFWNLATLRGGHLAFVVPPPLRWIGHVTMLRQTWDMFYEPTQHQGWYVVRARLRDGTELDLLRPDAMDEVHDSKQAWRQLKGFRWRFFLRRLSYEENASLREDVARYLITDANTQLPADRQVVSLELRYCRPLRDEGESGITVDVQARAGKSSLGRGDPFLDSLRSLESGLGLP